jgi:GNAT superfamily N-acetyltransferase
MADLLVTNRLEPAAWGPARVLLLSAGALDLTGATDLFGLVPLDGGADRPAAAALRRYGDAAELLALVVRADRRGRGLGGRLLDGVADALRAGGSDRLWVIDDGTAGCRWLSEHGFAQVPPNRLRLVL